MLRGYRGIILASGFILAGAGLPSSKDGQLKAINATVKVERSLEDMATTLREANKPTNLEQPCEKGDNKRSSDLCAQWKAADAAHSVAYATWIFGLLGAIIGALTLAAAWSAARWAKKAADHTEIGANESKRAADAAEKSVEGSDRPHLLMDSCKLNLTEPNLNGEYPLTFKFVNHGKGPCWIRSWVATVRIGTPEEPVEAYPLIQRNPGNPWAIPPGGNWLSIEPIAFPIPFEEANAVTAGEKVCTVFWSIRYDDSEGREHAHDLVMQLRAKDVDELVPFDHPFCKYT